MTVAPVFRPWYGGRIQSVLADYDASVPPFTENEGGSGGLCSLGGAAASEARPPLAARLAVLGVLARRRRRAAAGAPRGAPRHVKTAARGRVR